MKMYKAERKIEIERIKKEEIEPWKCPVCGHVLMRFFFWLL
jgi:rubrerythrin